MFFPPSGEQSSSEQIESELRDLFPFLHPLYFGFWADQIAAETASKFVFPKVLIEDGDICKAFDPAQKIDIASLVSAHPKPFSEFVSSTPSRADIRAQARSIRSGTFPRHSVPQSSASSSSSTSFAHTFSFVPPSPPPAQLQVRFAPCITTQNPPPQWRCKAFRSALPSRSKMNDVNAKLATLVKFDSHQIKLCADKEGNELLDMALVLEDVKECDGVRTIYFECRSVSVRLCGAVSKDVEVSDVSATVNAFLTKHILNFSPATFSVSSEGEELDLVSGVSDLPLSELFHFGVSEEPIDAMHVLKVEKHDPS
jgi:hypothetical protein